MGSPHSHPQHHRPRAHKAHPIPPPHIQAPPPPPAPPGLSVQGYLIAIIGKAGAAISRWRAFGSAVEKAYVLAYQAQAGVLEQVKVAQEARRKDAEAAFNFALNILTIGIGGGLATAAEKYVVNNIGEKAKDLMTQEGAELVKKFAGSISDKVTDKLADQAREVGEWAFKYGHPSVEDAFKPPGVNPTEFGATIRDSIESRAADLESTVSVFTDPDFQQSLSAEAAKFWYETILHLPFVTDAPARIDAHHILPNAGVALWIAWAWERDRAYWHTQSQLGVVRNVAEELDFEPIRRALAVCGVPAAVINKSAENTCLNPMNMDKRSRQRVEDMVEDQKVDKIYDLTLIDMDKFITWANSAAVTDVLFSGLHHAQNLLWFKEVARRISMRQRFGWIAQYMPET